MPWSPDNPVIGEFEDLPVQMLSRSSYFVPADSVPPMQELLPPEPPVCTASSVLPASDAETAPIPATLPDCHPQVNADHKVDELSLPASKRRTVRRSPSSRGAVSKPPASLPADPIRAYLHNFMAGYPDADDQRAAPVSHPSNPPALGILLPSVSVNAVSAHSHRPATSALSLPERANVSATQTSRSNTPPTLPTRDRPPSS